MRDLMLLFHRNTAPTAASSVVDANSTEPGVGTVVNLSATIAGATVAGDVKCVLEGADEKAGTYAEVATFTISEARAKQQGVILSTPMPSTAKRFLKTTWTGLTGGTITDGLDYGLRDGSAATRPYLA